MGGDITPDDRTTQDEELAVATGLPSQTQVIELLGGEFARAGYEIEDVVIDPRVRPPRITVIADGDTALDLDAVAALSRSASALLDELDGIDDQYVLEVSSPGVQRPLTSEKHFRRARGRKVEMELSDGSQLTGRVGETGADAVALVVRNGRDWAVREIPLVDIAKAIVQVEFSSPSAAELDLAGAGESRRTEAGA
ncbi:ribosome maturation factor RimP [Mycobacterium montefiorense]|uniref:Ribosome maturation factor RimP n=1 Tax=Mycobacterium montefiorense TaxID=154654 RepID=A0AA37PR77_9MYCO|nr:ribosome maturation factor RimP [Mycobacterium montefiorense]GKU36004.1 ribosome maturation factor RimP [Mycobacterium montefiorense]GKU42093.1 ribosome maturation factor RimP [Mycobacterium montefiorense]GKU44269.1 ribosome maturation factor RimP [Mycobacterium montefiorense]GKU51774.1 ribosome maturation factor RimP [Mycobacterium montefiorense]